MTKTQRDLLADLMSYCNNLGNTLDGTATNSAKYIERQRAHSLVSTVLYGVFGDHEENDFRDNDISKAKEALGKLKELVNKTYPDKNGYLKPEEVKWNKINNQKVKNDN